MANALSLAAPLITQLVTNYAQSAPADDGTSSADPNGPHGQTITQFYNTFKPLFGLASSDQQVSMDVASAPTPYSTDAIPSDVQNDPMSQLRPDELARLQRFTSDDAMMATAYYDRSSARSSGGVEVRDHRGRDYDSPSGGVVVRDHRHPVREYYPPAAQPPASTGTNFTSAADYDKLNQANSTFKDAKQAALDDPTDPAKQLAFQEAAQALQLLVNMLTQISSMFASIADNAIKSSKVSPA